jgi:hypothetical protein
MRGDHKMKNTKTGQRLKKRFRKQAVLQKITTGQETVHILVKLYHFWGLNRKADIQLEGEVR